MSNWTKSAQSPVAWQRSKLAVATGLLLAGFKSIGTGALLRTAYAVLRELPLTPEAFGCVGDGVTNDDAAWQLWSSACQANQIPGRITCGKTYLIDSWVVNTAGSVFYGDNVGVEGLSIGAKIKCRANIAVFVDFSGASASSLNNIEIDGNNHATVTFAITSQTFSFTSSKVTVGGCVDNGINCDLSGTTTNTQVAEMTFSDWVFAGRGNRGSGSGITNLKVNSDQTLVMVFIRPMFGGFAVTADTDCHCRFVLGTVTMYSPFWTAGGTNDVKIGNGGAGGGSITIIDGRSESVSTDSILVDGGAGDISLWNFVHATTTNTSLSATANFTGRINTIGGQFNIITNNSASAEFAMINPHMYGTGSYQGTYLNRICKLEAGTLTTRALAARAAAGTMLTFEDTTNAKTFYANWVNDALTLYRNGPAELCNWDNASNLTNQGQIKAKSKIYPGTDAGALQTAAGIYAGTGAPNNANGANGDVYIRSDGGALTTMYQRRAGAWVGVV